MDIMNDLDDIYFLRMAYEVAYDFSTDPSTQNGAILVNEEGEALAEGANHFPQGVEEKEGRWERPLKYSYVEHAERNVIYAACRQGIKTEGLVMYCPWAACDNCARAIIQAGIKEVICHHDPHAEDGQRFGMPVHPQWSKSIEVALGMLKEAGVGLHWVAEKLYPDNDLKVRFNGKMVSP